MAERSRSVDGPRALSERSRILTELEHLLEGPECPACQYVEEAERSFFSWFAIESYTTVEMQTRLRASIGMCPAHVRRLIDEVSQPHILTAVLRQAVTGAQDCLRGSVAPGVCPACEATTSAAARVSRLAAEGLLDSTHARLYTEHVGMCLPHLLQTIAVADEPVVKVLAERMLVTLEESWDGALVERLAGVDRDGTERAACREALPNEQEADSTVEGLCRRLALGSCPVCLATGLIERDYVRWYCERTGEHDPSLESDPGELCSPHLHDLAIADQRAAIDAAHRKRAARQAELRRLLDTTSRIPASTRRRRNSAHGLDGARAEVLAEHHCSACHARTGVDHSQLALVAASVSLASIRECYVNSHGLCARHALRLHEDEAAGLAKRHADARLGVLAWELHESGRKQAWGYRHEPSGPEQDAGLRAAAQIDGRVFEGGPPRR